MMIASSYESYLLILERSGTSSLSPTRRRVDDEELEHSPFTPRNGETAVDFRSLSLLSGTGEKESVRLDVQLAEVGGGPALDGDLVAGLARRAAAPAAVVPGSQPPFAGRRVLDLEVAVGVGHGEVRMVEDADPCLHPAVNVALHADRPVVGLQAVDTPLLLGRDDACSAPGSSSDGRPRSCCAAIGELFLPTSTWPSRMASECGMNMQQGWSISTFFSLTP